MKPIRIVLSVMAASSMVALHSCNEKENIESEDQLLSGILIKNMDTLVNPGDNFHAYVNGYWLKNNPIPADKSAYGVAHIIDDKAQENVRAIIEASAKGDFADGSNEQKIGDLYESFMDQKARDSKGIAPLAPEFATIDAIKTYDDLAAYFGKAGKSGFKTPFAVGVIEDFKDPTKYMLYTWQGGLGLPDREYYLLQDAKSKSLRDKYVAHIGTMLKLANVTDADNAATKIMALETAMAGKHAKKEENRNIAGMYNKHQIKELNKLMPTFNWTSMLQNAGISGEKEIIITQPSYMKSVDALIKSTPIDTWKTYLKWGVVDHAATLLTSEIDNKNFEFFGKTLYGQQQQKPHWRRAVDAVNGSLGEVVGEVYVKKHFTPEAKKRMTDLVQNLLKAYEVSIKELDWMTPETKKEALTKLSKFTPKIGYPDKWRDYGALKIIKGDLYGNMQRASAFEYDRQIKKLGTKVDRDEWGMTPQTVNAYYNPMLNEIVFPAAILQPPFFDMTVEDAANYGSIGAVIGHEIGHGFDDQGSTFDGDGVMRNWWTDKDQQAFKQRTSALVSQYNQYKVFPDLSVNGEFTLGENIGDLGGLSIALKAYKMSLDGKESPVIDGFTGEQRVFLSYAQSWMTKSREESMRNQIASDPHSPAKFRVNGIVRNIPEFYTAFKIKPTDSLYLAPEKRVKIW